MKLDMEKIGSRCGKRGEFYGVEIDRNGVVVIRFRNTSNGRTKEVADAEQFREGRECK
jgi:flagellar hook protein FlgE